MRENERVCDTALDEVRFQKEASKRIQNLEDRKKLDEAAKNQGQQILVEGTSAPKLITDWTSRLQLNPVEAAHESSEYNAREIRDTADMPKKAGRKRRCCPRKLRHPNRSSPTDAETENPLLRIQTTRITLPEDYVALELGTQSSTSREVIEEGPSDPSELPNGNGPAKHRRPGKRNSKRDHRFEAEKRKSKEQKKKADMARFALGGPEEAHEK